jgi:Tol biopolymer transport system component
LGLPILARPVWTPDGHRLTFRASRNAVVGNLYWQRADGSGDVQRLTDSQNWQVAGSWHPTGKFLAFGEVRPETGGDLMMLPLEGDEVSGWRPGKPTVFLSTPFSELDPVFSPDGRWVAYTSQETGRGEVYVRPFPGPEGKWRVSTDGGSFPTWSRTRSELFYASPDNHLMVAPYAVEGNSFKADKPRVWSQRRFMTRPGRPFDLHPDGERFALVAAPENVTAVQQDKLVFIFNFFDELRRIAPASTR